MWDADDWNVSSYSAASSRVTELGWTIARGIGATAMRPRPRRRSRLGIRRSRDRAPNLADRPEQPAVGSRRREALRQPDETVDVDGNPVIGAILRRFRDVPVTGDTPPKRLRLEPRALFVTASCPRGRRSPRAAGREAFEPRATGDQRVEVDARLDAFALEQIDEVLRRDVAGRARRVRAAAEAADRGVEHASRRRRARQGSSRSPCCACCARGSRPRRSASTSARTRDGVATPIVSASTTSARPAKRAARSTTTPGSTRPRTGSRSRRRSSPSPGTAPARARIASARATASASVAFPFSRLNDSVAAKVTFTRSSAARREPLPAALVQHEPGVLGAVAPLDRRDDLLRARHLRHAVVADEAHRLDRAASPAAASRFTSSARTAGARVSGSFCRPSRGPTSQSVSGTRDSLVPCLPTAATAGSPRRSERLPSCARTSRPNQ